LNCKIVHRVWALIRGRQKLGSGVQTLCVLCLLIAALCGPARADCPAAPIADKDDMVISFLVANGVQIASGSQQASTVKQGMLVYDSSVNRLKYCDGTDWKALVDAGSAAGTLAGLSDVDVTGVSNGKILVFDGGTGKWVVGSAPATGAAGSATEVQFRNGSSGAFDADSGFVYDKTQHRLGVGTASPILTLDVADDINGASGIHVGNSNSGGGFATLILEAQGGQGSLSRGWLLGPGPASVLYDDQSIYLYTGTGSFVSMIGGNVGIGLGYNGIPSTKLQVAGGVQLGDDAAACPGSSNTKIGTLKFAADTLSLCKATGWAALMSGSAASAAGPNGAVQFNDGGALAGVSVFTYDRSAGLNVQNLNATGTAINASSSSTAINASSAGTAVNATGTGASGSAINAVAVGASGTALTANALGNAGTALRASATGANAYAIYSQGRMHVTGALTALDNVTVGKTLKLTPQTGLAPPVMP
jgi:hypothetical protein